MSFECRIQNAEFRTNSDACALILDDGGRWGNRRTGTAFHFRTEDALHDELSASPGCLWHWADFARSFKAPVIRRDFCQSINNSAQAAA